MRSTARHSRPISVNASPSSEVIGQTGIHCRADLHGRGKKIADQPVTCGVPKPFTEAERQEFLADKHIAVLSVAATDGRPPASVPIWYDYTPGGDIRINTGANTRKARLLREAGVVTLVVQREELPYQYIIVEGTVVEATTPSPREAREAIATRYLGPEAGREFADQMDGIDSVLLIIRPDRWITQNYSDVF